MEIKPLGYVHLENKKTRIAEFYSESKDKIDYNLLHESFLDVCEEVMRYGLE